MSVPGEGAISAYLHASIPCKLLTCLLEKYKSPQKSNRTALKYTDIFKIKVLKSAFNTALEDSQIGLRVHWNPLTLYVKYCMCIFLE